MTTTTLRVEIRQRDQLKAFAERHQRTMIDTLDAALEALRRREFFADMALAEERLRQDPAAWAEYQAESAAWLDFP
jgi:hypothetical protein